MIVHKNIEQHSPEWFQLKVGKPSTSNFHKMMSNKAGTKTIGDTANTYALELALERYTGEITQIPKTSAMERGTRLEPQAREYYKENTFRNIIEIGGIENYGCYCSTDGIEDGENIDRLLEIKCHNAKLHYEFLLDPKKFINKHKWQIHGSLFLSGANYIDVVAYHPKFDDKQLIITVEKDEKINIQIQNRIGKFLKLIDKYLLQIKNLKTTE